VGRVQECVHDIKKNIDSSFFNFRFNIIINFKLKKKRSCQIRLFLSFYIVATQFLTHLFDKISENKKNSKKKTMKI